MCSSIIVSKAVSVLPYTLVFVMVVVHLRWGTWCCWIGEQCESVLHGKDGVGLFTLTLSDSCFLLNVFIYFGASLSLVFLEQTK